jgi:hypothetical protein
MSMDHRGKSLSRQSRCKKMSLNSACDLSSLKSVVTTCAAVLTSGVPHSEADSRLTEPPHAHLCIPLHSGPKNAPRTGGRLGQAGARRKLPRAGGRLDAWTPGRELVVAEGRLYLRTTSPNRMLQWRCGYASKKAPTGSIVAAGAIPLLVELLRGGSAEGRANAARVLNFVA